MKEIYRLKDPVLQKALEGVPGFSEALERTASTQLANASRHLIVRVVIADAKMVFTFAKEAVERLLVSDEGWIDQSEAEPPVKKLIAVELYRIMIDGNERVGYRGCVYYTSTQLIDPNTGDPVDTAGYMIRWRYWEGA